MAIKKRKNPTKRQTRKKKSYFANLGEFLRSIGYTGNITKLKTIYSREEAILRSKYKTDDGKIKKYTASVLKLIAKSSKPGQQVSGIHQRARRNPAHQGLKDPMNLAAVAAGAFIVHCCVK